VSELHETIERRLLAPYKVALLLDNGSLALMDSHTGMQIALDATSAYSLLDLLNNHKDLLHRLSQQSGESEKDTSSEPKLVRPFDVYLKTLHTLQQAGELPASEDQPAMSNQDEDAIKAAEDYVIDRYTSLSRYTIAQNWQLEPEQMTRLEFNEDGSSLACGIQSSKIVEHTSGPSEEWIIEVMPDIGIKVEPERLRVYQALDGSWIAEQD